MFIDQAVVAVMCLALLAFEHTTVSILHALAAVLWLVVVLTDLDHRFVALGAGPLDPIVLRAGRIRTQLKVDDRAHLLNAKKLCGHRQKLVVNCGLLQMIVLDLEGLDVLLDGASGVRLAAVDDLVGVIALTFLVVGDGLLVLLLELIHIDILGETFYLSSQLLEYLIQMETARMLVDVRELFTGEPLGAEVALDRESWAMIFDEFLHAFDRLDVLF